MTGLLEVIALHPADAKRATEGGADRIELVGTMEHDGLSPEPALVGQVTRATNLPVRVMLRLREGFSTDATEIVRLKQLISAYRDLGADGVVLGFLNSDTEVDLPVLREVIEDIDFGWTFHRAIDSSIWTDRAWRALQELPHLDQVLTAGSVRTVAEGLDELVARAKQNPFARKLIMAGGGLKAEHVPWLARAGVTAFHVGSSVRPTGSWKAYIDPELVRTWRRLVDDAVSRAAPS
ncbi:copper homeostasis protein CutC [Microlunatus speluncae]|uniref:copper homeostasis protein CutC n=1 Tax=Microlunatus speluncae TaxID=2594267 RepID=UPI0012667905|nr:copper homeostasis protein CutC [Microlunatus speluncae]